jgi:hypothetical protein
MKSARAAMSDRWLCVEWVSKTWILLISCYGTWSTSGLLHAIEPADQATLRPAHLTPNVQRKHAAR